MAYIGQAPTKVPLTSADIADGTIALADIATNQIDETLMKDAFVGDFSDVTVTAADAFLYGDATDSGNTKKDTVQGILDLASGGSWTHIETIVPSAAAYVTFSHPSLSTTYRDYMIYIGNVGGITADKNLQMQYGSGVSVTWKASGYYGAMDWRSSSSTTIQQHPTDNASHFSVAPACATASGAGHNGMLYIGDRTNDVIGYSFFGENNHADSGGYPGWFYSAGNNSPTNITNIRFNWESDGNFAAGGYFALYGRNIP